MIVFRPDGRQLLTGGPDERYWLWDIALEARAPAAIAALAQRCAPFRLDDEGRLTPLAAAAGSLPAG